MDLLLIFLVLGLLGSSLAIWFLVSLPEIIYKVWKAIFHRSALREPRTLHPLVKHYRDNQILPRHNRTVEKNRSVPQKKAGKKEWWEEEGFDDEEEAEAAIWSMGREEGWW